MEGLVRQERKGEVAADVRSVEVLERLGGAGLDDEEFGVAILQAVVNKVEVAGVLGDSIGEESGGKGVGAQRLAKEAHSGGDVGSEGGGGTRDKALNVGEGVAKAEGVVGERLGGIPNGNARGCGHEFGFAVIEVDAQGSTFLFNETEDGDDVS